MFAAAGAELDLSSCTDVWAHVAGTLGRGPFSAECLQSGAAEPPFESKAQGTGMPDDRADIAMSASCCLCHCIEVQTFARVCRLHFVGGSVCMSSGDECCSVLLLMCMFVWCSLFCARAGMHVSRYISLHS